MPIISSTLSGAGYSPSQPIPENPVEVIFDGVSYTCPEGDDLFSPTTAGTKIVNIFSGSKQLDASFFGIHATGFPNNGGSLSDVQGGLVRTHDWTYAGVNLRWRNIETNLQYLPAKENLSKRNLYGW